MSETTRFEIRMSGFGGQGIILMGKVLGSAAALHHDHHATLIQSYGPETRGSSCRVDLILDAKPIDFPYLTRPQLLVTLSQAAFQLYRPTLAAGGVLIYEEDLVSLGDADRDGHGDEPTATRHPVPAVKLAEECGGRIMANIVVLGYIAAITDWVSLDALAKTIKGKMAPALAEKNLAAVQCGYEFGHECLAREDGLRLESLTQALQAQKA